MKQLKIGYVWRMRHLIGVALMVLLPSRAWSDPLPISVVVTLPVLLDLVQNVGKERVQVQSLITGLEGEHTYTPKPSDMRALQKAKLLVTIGLGLETFLDPLIKNADRPDLARVVASLNVPTINKNPHIWLDPENVKIMVTNIAEGLIRLDPDGQAFYRSHAELFRRALDQLTRDMMSAVAPLPPERRKIITHHAAWPYFAKRLGFLILGEIQTQRGTHESDEPSAKRISELIRRIRAEKVPVIVSEPQLSQKIPRILAEETGVRQIVLSPQPGGTFPETYLAFMRENVKRLMQALQE